MEGHGNKEVDLHRHSGIYWTLKTCHSTIQVQKCGQILGLLLASVISPVSALH